MLASPVTVPLLFMGVVVSELYFIVVGFADALSGLRLLLLMCATFMISAMVAYSTIMGCARMQERIRRENQQGETGIER